MAGRKQAEVIFSAGEAQAGTTIFQRRAVLLRLTVAGRFPRVETACSGNVL